MIAISIFRKICWHRTALIITVLAGALCIKQFYSHATVDELRWILAPTTTMIEFLSGWEFEFESHSGYLNKEHLFLITSSCSGMNFLIASFVMVSLLGLIEAQTKRLQWRAIVFGIIVAYIATVVINAIRISIAMWLREAQFSSGSLDVARVHRLEGIIVYFGALLSLWSLCGGRNLAIVNSSWVPLCAYYGIALIIPILNGAKGVHFWEHAIFVLIVPILIVFTAKVLRSRLKCFGYKMDPR